MPRILLLALVPLLLAALAGCTLSRKSAPVQAGTFAQNLANGSGDGGPDSAPDPLSFVGTAGVRDFAQIRQSMSAVTGIPATDPSVQTYFAGNGGNGAVTRFSTDGTADGVTPSMLLATTGLASVYCSKFIAAEKALTGASASQRKVFQSVDFSKDQSGLTADVRKSVFTNLARLFWRRDPTPTELATLSTAVDEALQGQAPSTTQTTNAMLISCTAALSSLDFIQG